MTCASFSAEALPEVCNELREKIIDELSRNPGHFGPVWESWS